MSALEIFWTCVFIFSTLAFFGVAFIVSVKGIGDVKELFRHLSDENR